MSDCFDHAGDAGQISMGMHSSSHTSERSKKRVKYPGFVVYPDGSMLPVIVEDEVLDIQKAVGGYFELIEETDTYFVYVDEDGHSKRLKPNVHTFSLIKRKVTLVGPVLFLFKNPVDKQEE